MSTIYFNYVIEHQ